MANLTDSRSSSSDYLHLVTPLVESTSLSALLGVPVLLKLENTQPSGSFKIRGIGHFIQREVASSAVHGMVSSSGGNAGMAAAYAARRLGLPVTVVVPTTTPCMMMDLIRREGATVLVHGSVFNEADEKARELGKDQGLLYVHPFDHSLVWAGVSTLVDEVLEQCGGVEPACFVLSVGGGGLLCGVLEGLIRNGLSHVPVLAMETEGAACFNAAIKAGRPVSVGTITSLAKTLGALTVCSRVLSLLPTCSVYSRLVSDRQAVQACRLFLDDHRYLVEPACGAALAGVYCGALDELLQAEEAKDNGREDLTQVAEEKKSAGTRLEAGNWATNSKKPVVVIVCGGNAATLELLRMWEQETGC